MGEPSGPPQPGQGTRAELDLEAAAAAEQLSTTQSIAENWKNGLAGLVGLISAILVLKGPTAVEKIARDYAYVIAAALAASLVTSVIATWYSLRASYGVPKVVKGADIRAAGGLDVYRAERARVAVRDLNLARWLAIAGAVLLASATGALWFAPAPDAPSSYLEVRLADGQRLCGRPTAAPAGMVALVDRSKVTQIVAPADIRALTMHAAPDCRD